MGWDGGGQLLISMGLGLIVSDGDQSSLRSSKYFPVRSDLAGQIAVSRIELQLKTHFLTSSSAEYK